VQRRAADACVTSPVILKTLSKDFSSPFRQVGKTEHMPGVAFLAHKRLSETIRMKLRSEILSWKDSEQGRSILNSIQFGNFVPVRPDEYEKLNNSGK
jgi:ABC-type phosphate/phosphonate transport system substrate-binding protein